MFWAKNTDGDKQFQRRIANPAVSLLSAVIVLCGVATVTVGDAPIVPCNSSVVLSSEIYSGRPFLSFPESGRIPMLMFLPNFKADSDPDISETVLPENALPVVSLTLQPPASMDGEDGVYINNEAQKNINIRSLLDSDISTELKRDGSVQVIIYHTHGSESYNDDGVSYYGDEFYKVHTSDISRNVVRIGSIIAEKLREKGIGVVHDTTMYDLEGYSDAYDRSCDGVEKLLEEYPGAKLILDIHRDTIILNDGSKYRPVTEYRNESAAQMMILVGTGKSSAPNDHWTENLSAAVKLQRVAESICKNIMRPLLLRNSGYNQHLSAGSILVEMGTCGNSLREAELSAEILSQAIVGAFVE